MSKRNLILVVTLFFLFGCSVYMESRFLFKMQHEHAHEEKEKLVNNVVKQ